MSADLSLSGQAAFRSAMSARLRRQISIAEFNALNFSGVLSEIFQEAGPSSTVGFVAALIRRGIPVNLLRFNAETIRQARVRASGDVVNILPATAIQGTTRAEGSGAFVRPLQVTSRPRVLERGRIPVEDPGFFEVDAQIEESVDNLGRGGFADGGEEGPTAARIGSDSPRTQTVMVAIAAFVVLMIARG